MREVEAEDFGCEGCGSQMRYSPARMELLCEYCGNSSPIERRIDRESEELQKALARSHWESIEGVQRSVHCPGCGASRKLEAFVVAGECEYCSSPLVTEFCNPEKPGTILPFKISRAEAHEIFANWIGSLWFAPTRLRLLVDKYESLTGYYLPFHLFSADTLTLYKGERGDAYYENEVVARVVNGREESSVRKVRKIRWSPVNGMVSRKFRDLPIAADDTIPMALIERIEPWDSSSTRESDKRYLSGFYATEYNRALSQSHKFALEKMRRRIEYDVRRDIGGDEQRVFDMDIHYKEERYRYTLFPVWSASFRYGGKEYRYLINGFNGRVSGERPYSYIKIATAILVVFSILAVIAYWDNIKEIFIP